MFSLFIRMLKEIHSINNSYSRKLGTDMFIAAVPPLTGALIKLWFGHRVSLHDIRLQKRRT